MEYFIVGLMLLGNVCGFEHPIRVSSGLFLRPAATSTVIYSNSAPLIFEIGFEFTKPQNFQWGPTRAECNEEEAVPECPLINGVHTNLVHLQKRMSQLIQSYTTVSMAGPNTSFIENLAKTRRRPEVPSELLHNNTVSRRPKRNIFYDIVGGWYHLCCGLATQSDLEPLISTSNTAATMAEGLRGS